MAVSTKGSSSLSTVHCPLSTVVAGAGRGSFSTVPARANPLLHLGMTRRTRQGFSFTEVCVAILILTLCLVPALRALPALMASQTDVETKHLLGLVAQEKLADAVLSLRTSFVERYEYGATGNASLRYLISVTLPAEGSGRYAIVSSLAWVDTDGTHNADAVPDAGGPLVRFDTLVANCAWSPTP